MGWRRWALGTLLMTTLAACTSRQRPPADAEQVIDHTTDAPRVVVDTLPSTELDKPTATPTAAQPAPSKEPIATPSSAAPPAEPAPEATTADPFNSDSVDKNREGRHIMDRALKMPVADGESTEATQDSR